MLDELQCSLDLLCPKVKVFKDNVGERKANLQLEEEEWHFKIRANLQDYEVKGSLLNQPT